MKVAIADYHAFSREYLRDLCTKIMKFTVVGDAEDGHRAIELIVRTRPDIVILDSTLPFRDGFDVVRVVRDAGCRPRILIFSASCDDNTVLKVERARVNGFIDKRLEGSGTICKALSSLVEGRTYFSNSYLQVRSARIQNPKAFDKLLSDCEQRFLSLLGECYSDEQIAERLGISSQTVEKHRSNIRKKLGIGAKMELLRYLRDHGFMHTLPAPVQAVQASC